MSELETLILSRWPELSAEVRANVLRFYDYLIEENTKQNLTRLTSPLDFCEGHLEDVRQLFGAGVLRFPAMDLGSGGGVPGLLAAIIRPDRWILCDSEASKARFLSETVLLLGLQDHVEVFSGRAEEYLKTKSVASIVARAVGPIGRIYSWIGHCSTWNMLILLKGPGWEAEWLEFNRVRKNSQLTTIGTREYSVGILNKQRKIVALQRG